MDVDVGPLTRWSARAVGLAVAAYFLLTLIQQTIAAAERGGLGGPSAAVYVSMSLLWLAAIGLVVGLVWPYFGGFLTVTNATASIMLLLLEREPLQPAVVLVAAAGALFVADGAMRRAGDPRNASQRAA